MSLLEIEEVKKPEGFQAHGRPTYLIALSRLLERFGHYGLKNFIFLYLIDETLGIPENEATTFYVYLGLSATFLYPLGGILGDFLFKTKNATLVGSLLQVSGILVIIYPNITTVYFGLGIYMLGEGIYTPNLLARYGKIYSNNKSYLDSGFSFLLFAVSLGGILSSAIYFVAESNFILAFIVSAAAICISVAINYSVPNTEHDTVKGNEKDMNSFKNKWLVISLLLATALFASTQFVDKYTFDIQSGILSSLNLDTSMETLIQYSITSGITFLLSIAFFFYWTFKKGSSIWRFTIGVVMTAIACGLMQMATFETNPQLVLLVSSLVLFGVANAFTAPTIFSILVRYTSPRYLGTFMGLYTLPAALLVWLFALPIFAGVSFQISPLVIPSIVLFIIGGGILVYLSIAKPFRNKSVEE